MHSASDSRQYNSRLGLILFAIYLSIYLGFVVLSAFASGVMEKRVLMGLNLAIVYGFALIIGAFVMAMIYGLMCRSEPIPSTKPISGVKPNPDVNAAGKTSTANEEAQS
ncbi:DUF485 domain-containing protein [Stieleria varia]|uniref:DUF485 domain-containing protein n=1 Tax=Stieleria varia TaxID=2528005 RepID=A0A5C6AZN0_9BACT|nr:DUF485 domain-containing protein [Stieleria varia]TWU05108.1 hypothetical protein Pla52n_31540 [Stieleria varia]